MKEIAKTIEKAQKHALFCVEIPIGAAFEIRWSTGEVSITGEEQTLPNCYKDGGPMLIACLTD